MATAVQGATLSQQVSIAAGNTSTTLKLPTASKVKLWWPVRAFIIRNTIDFPTRLIQSALCRRGTARSRCTISL